MNAQEPNAAVPAGRGIYTNRTLNLRAIKAIGYDMDYTLVHYHVAVWERRAYEYMKQKLTGLGWPLESLKFDPNAVIRGLIIDTEKGNLLKANRFGFVKKACHGTRELSFEQMNTEYARTIVDLSDRRWSFMNTLFSISEGCLYSQLVDLLDAHELPGVMGYQELYRKVLETLDATHLEGNLKADIIADPNAYVFPDPETVLALLDQKHAGKKLMLITNSEWFYTSAMMSFSFDRHLPKGMGWKELFDVIIVGARKPEFFTSNSPFFEVATEDGLLRTNHGPLKPHVAYLGGSARQLEKSLGLAGDQILYVGDHMFGDVHFTKSVLRWRTALVLRELEDEVRELEAFSASEGKLAALMHQKELLEAEGCDLRVLLQRRRAGYGAQQGPSDDKLLARQQEIRALATALDEQLGPLAKAASELTNSHWGLLTRAGNDKSNLARQVERYADIYTSRVSNFLACTPFAYLRSRRGSLPHDPSVPGGVPTSTP